MNAAVRLQGVRKTFGSATAVQDLDLEVPTGALYGVIGPNSAPAWQVWLTIAIGLASVAASVWCASKVFTIGLLMYGKPPDLKTLIRWIRQA